MNHDQPPPVELVELGAAAQPDPAADDDPAGPSPKTPSDSFSPLTLTGSRREARGDRVHPAHDAGGVVELVGPLAASALAHPRVEVVAMPHPEIPSACDVATMEVQSVVAIS